MSLLAFQTNPEVRLKQRPETAAEGGIFNLGSGDYVLTEDMVIPSKITVAGVGPTLTRIICGQFQVRTELPSAYTTGTITATSGVNITGSGTSWLANVTPGQHLFLGTRWYEIAAVTSNTTLVISEPYDGAATLPSTYRIATISTDIAVENLSIIGSTKSGLLIKDARRVKLNNLLLVQNNIGLEAENVSEFSSGLITSAASAGDGVRITNIGISNLTSVNSSGNGGNGVTLNNARKLGVTFSDYDSNAGDGIRISNSHTVEFLVSTSGNGGIGAHLVTGCENINIFNAGSRGNAGDGVKLAATCDNCKILTAQLANNGGFGVNIAAASCDNNIILGNVLANNGSGSVNDSGTGTLIRSNIGVVDN